MAESSPCKGCDHEDQSKDKHPECVRCIEEGVPGKYANRIEDRYPNDPEVVMKDRAFRKSEKLDKISKVKKHIEKICRENGITVGVLLGSKKDKGVSKIRRKIAQGLRESFRLSDGEIAKALEITPSAVWYIFKNKKESVQGKGLEKKKKPEKAKKIEEEQEVDEYPGKKLLPRTPDIDFKDITIGQLLNRREGLIDRVVKAAEWDLRTPENQILFYIWQGVEKN